MHNADHPAISDRARRIYDTAIVADMTMPWSSLPGDMALHDAMPDRLCAAGVTYVSFTVATDDADNAGAITTIAAERRWWLARGDCLLVRTADDIVRAKREGKLAVGFHFQGTRPVERNLDMVELFYQLGIRHMLMAYNQKNFVGDGCHELGEGGLSRFGHELVREMNRVGMLVDVAHTGYRTSMDAIAASSAPVIVSHGNVAAFHKHPRCYADDQIKAIAATGGVFGLTGLGIFLGGNDASTSAYVRQIDHIAQLVGPAHVGFGLDYVFDMRALSRLAMQHASKWPEDGGYTTADIAQVEPERLPAIADALLARGYAEADVANVLGGNWLRVARAVWR
jgi:membrane dipeptidase